MPDGSFLSFEVKATPVFDSGLSAKYPGYYSFTGAGVEQPGSWLKMSVSPFGINIMIHTEKDGFSFLDPYNRHNNSEYISYYKRDLIKKTVKF